VKVARRIHGPENLPKPIPIHLNPVTPIDRRGALFPELHILNPNASSWSISPWKRILDLSIALPALLVFALPMLAIAICVHLSSRGQALFVQRRVGRGGRLFRLYKFRTMAGTGDESTGPGITKDGDQRVTSLGRWLRKLKLDELPQFYNVLRGDMSLVGPRPKLQQYAALINMPYRPGITGEASIAFRCEEEMLSGIPEAKLEEYYHLQIKPLKAQIDACYMCEATLGSDLRIIARTFLACVAPSRASSIIGKRLSQSALCWTNGGKESQAVHSCGSENAEVFTPLRGSEGIVCGKHHECQPVMGLLAALSLLGEEVVSEAS
jgi:lipopolysaccharide/colanic/teichoic acid biosynthesis glycosyltransferase